MYEQEKTTPAGEKLYVEKNDLKKSKIDFSDMEIWLLSENRIFRPRILEITLTKSTLPAIAVNTACNDVLILFLWRSC